MENLRLVFAPRSYDGRLARRVRLAEDNASQAALTLFECRDPQTLAEAVDLVCPDRRPSTDVFDAVADAWERYRHLRDLPWD